MEICTCYQPTRPADWPSTSEKPPWYRSWPKIYCPRFLELRSSWRPRMERWCVWCKEMDQTRLCSLTKPFVYCLGRQKQKHTMISRFSMTRFEFPNFFIILLVSFSAQPTGFVPIMLLISINGEVLERVIEGRLQNKGNWLQAAGIYGGERHNRCHSHIIQLQEKYRTKKQLYVDGCLGK